MLDILNLTSQLPVVCSQFMVHVHELPMVSGFGHEYDLPAGFFF